MKSTKIVHFRTKRAPRPSGWPPEPPTPTRMPVPTTWRLTLAVGRAA